METHSTALDAEDLIPPALMDLLGPKMHGRIDRWAVSAESSLTGELFAHAATQGRLSFAQLQDQVERGEIEGIDPRILSRMAHSLAIQHIEPAHDAFVLKALRLALANQRRMSSNLRFRRLLVEMLYARGEHEEVRRILSKDPDLSAEFSGYLRADAINPFATDRTAGHEAWLKAFNRPFTGKKLAPLRVDPDAAKPFDTLCAPTDEVIEGGPLVSVILTTYNPDLGELTTALNSILNQTWRNLEVLLIDDCSPDTDPAVLDALAAQDDRIRLIRMERNGGTYRARNAGLRAARGEYITGQDTDDWSHPQRLALQVQHLHGRPDLVGVMTWATRVDDRMVRVARGLDPDRRCEVSLMVRREDAIGVGGYLPFRKAADSEFRERLERWSGRPVEAMDYPLYVIRLSFGSLSRSDFRPGWNHPMRRGFRNAYRHWHATSRPEDLALDLYGEDTRPFVGPANMRGKEYQPKHFDLCFIADWRRPSSSVRSAVDEIRACLDAGLSVSVLQLDAPYGLLMAGAVLVAPVQEMINRGEIGQVYAHGPDTVGTVIVRDPAVIHLGHQGGLGLTPDRVVLVGDEDLAGMDRQMQTYIPRRAQEMAEAMFPAPVEWTVTRKGGLEAFQTQHGVPVSGSSYPLVVGPRWHAHRLRPARTAGPAVVGRHSGLGPVDWPVDELEMSQAYPTDGTVDLRLMGEATAVLRVLGEVTLPPSWVAFSVGEIDPLVFWRAADFLVKFDSRGRTRGNDREMLEAMAAGTVVITDQETARLYPGLVKIATPETAAQVMEQLRTGPEEYLRLAGAARDYARDAHDGRRFLRYIKNHLSINDGMSE